MCVRFDSIFHLHNAVNVDYSPPTGQTYTFRGGSMRECLNMIVLRDSISENTETVSGRITNVELGGVTVLNTPVVMITQSTTNIAIEDGA